jgi:DNA-binding GntR family transcriptional regulator
VGAAFEALTQAAESRDARLVVDKDLAFHAAIVTLLGSSRLNEFYTELIRELRYYLMVLSATDGEFENPETVIAEHEPIASAIRDRAVQEVHTHIEANAKRLKEILAERP